MTVIGLDRIALEIGVACAEVIRTRIHRPGIANDGVDPSLQRMPQRLARIAVSERAAGRHYAVDEVRHRIALVKRGQPEMACPLDGWTNDPDGRRRQIHLQYAGIGGSYGCA